MKICPYCSSNMMDNAMFCPKCGSSMSNSIPNMPLQNGSMIVPMPYQQEKINSMALAGFITALCSLLLNFAGIVGIVATILSGVGLSQTSNPGKKGRGLAIAGVIIGILSIIYGFITVLGLIYILN